MTVKSQRNHYNIKFLKGYDHSISVKNSKIILKDNHDPCSEPEVEEWPPNRIPYEKIVLSGKWKYDLAKEMQKVDFKINPNSI